MDHTAVVATLIFVLGFALLGFAWAYRRWQEQVVENNELASDNADLADLTSGPITAVELARRGTDAYLEGCAIEIITRLGFPRPGDPLGVRPCIPVPVTEMEEVYEIAGCIPHAQKLTVELRRRLNTMLRNQNRIVCAIGDPQP